MSRKDKSPKRATISDVARRAGVSKTTVSRLINLIPDSMTDETQNRILEAMKELNFRPSAIARSLVQRQTHTVSLLISDVGNPFYSEVIRGIEQVGLEHGYRVLLCNTDYDLQRGFSFVDSLIGGQVDGVLLMTSRMDIALIRQFMDHQIPLVLWEWSEALPEAAGQLSANYQQGIDQAIDHLVELGHRRIAHICGTPGLPTATARIKAFQKAMSRHHLLDQAVIEAGNFKIDGGETAMRRLLALPEPPSAVFAANDLTAIGALRAIKNCGLHVPQDISLIGLDDVALASLMDPPLSSVALPRLEIGRLAMQTLLTYLRTPIKERICQTRVLETHLVVRQSTGRASRPPSNYLG